MEQFTKFDVNVPKLDFKVDYLFGMGCPLAGLLIARNQDPRYYHPDYTTVFENIYHPMDPLAFRLEPLLNPDFEEPAVSVEKANSQQSTSFTSMVFSLFLGTSNTTKTTMSDKNQGAVATKQEQGGGILSSLFGYFYPTSTSDDYEDEEPPQRRASEGDILRLKKPEPMTTSSQQRYRSQTMPSLTMRSSRSVTEDENPGRYSTSSEDSIMSTPLLSATPTSSCPTTAPQTPIIEQYERPLLSKKEYDNMMILDNTDIMNDFEKIESSEKLPPLPLGRRYDYELTPESFMGMISNEYILGLRAHFSYWTNKDMHWHIFCRMEGIEH